MKIKSAFLVSSICAGLVGCLDSAKQSSQDSNNNLHTDTSQLSVVEMASVSTDKNCSNGKEGAVAYDATQNAFFVCTQGQWLSVDLRGPKGDKGDSGTAGAVGATGASGTNGQNGRDGIDGNGVRLALRDGDTILGVLVQFQRSYSINAALVALRTGQYVYYTVDKGEPTYSASTVYYTGAGCTGDAFTGRTDDPIPTFINRVYASQTEYNGVKYYQVVGYPTRQESFLSYREYGALGTRGVCFFKPPTSVSGAEVKVIEIPAPPSLKNYAPLQFTL
jgi:hypothetical protein